MQASSNFTRPKEWTLAKFGDIAKITCGIAATPEYVDESKGVPFLSARNVQNGSLDLSKFQYIPVDLHKKLTKNTKPEKGDVLLTRVGAGIGEAAVVDIDFEFSIYVSLTLIKCGKTIHSEFVKALLSTEYYRYLATRDQFAGGGVQNLNVQMVKEYPIPLPPLPEQKKIAQILSTWEQAIATTERLLDLARQQKKALMQQLLTGKKRLPGFDREWKTHLLSNLFDFKKGKGLSKDALCVEGSKCVLYGELYTKYGEVITSILSRTKANDGLPSKTGDILIPSSTTTSGIDLANATAILEDGVLLGGDINVLRPKKKMNAVFMAHLLTHIKKNDIASRAQGITIIHLYSSDLKTISVHIPYEVEEQNKISSVLSNSQSEIDYLISQLDSLKQEKKALMQALLTGKRRVSVDE